MKQITAIEIQDVKKGSPAEHAGITPGDRLVTINGSYPRDILEYELLSANETLEVDVMRSVFTINKEMYEPLGLIFGTSVFDGIKTCANNCVFCFIDQLPEGMREAVYVKDDDFRLSFLYGNFITLTNLTEADIEIIISDRLSPLYVSLHAAEPALRQTMLGRKKADRSLEYLKRLSEAGISLHIQMVLCPGLNTGAALEQSIMELADSYHGVESVGLVPVGLTAHREELYPLRPFEKQEIIELVESTVGWQTRFESEKGCPWVYLADEFYIVAGLDIPPDEHYCEYPQIENGIGLSRLFIDGFERGLAQLSGGIALRHIAIVTGELFAPIMRGLCEKLEQAVDIEVAVVPIKNEYFGGCVDVTGLLTGSDIITGVKTWLKENSQPDAIIIPDVVLNADRLMLDGTAAIDIENLLGSKVYFISSDGNRFIEELQMIVRG